MKEIDEDDGGRRESLRFWPTVHLELTNHSIALRVQWRHLRRDGEGWEKNHEMQEEFQYKFKNESITNV